MLLVAIAVVGFLAAFALFVGAARPIVAAGAPVEPSSDSALARSPLAPVIRIFAAFNDRPAMVGHIASLDRKLVEAGRPGDGIRGDEFLALAELIGVALGGGLLLLFAFGGGLGAFPIVFSLAIGAIAVWLTHAWLDTAVADRRVAIGRQLPFFLDLAVMCMEAGATFLETIQIYERDNPEDALAEEFRIALGEVRMGRTVVEALESTGERIQLETLRSTINAIVQGQEMGTPLGEILRDQADVIRFRRSQDAERQAEELKVRVQGPVILMMIAVFILILGPAVLKVMQSGVF